MPNKKQQEEWKQWKENFCQHISDWSYFSADEELERMYRQIRTQAIEDFKEKMRGEIKNKIGKRADEFNKEDTVLTCVVLVNVRDDLLNSDLLK